MIFVSLKFRLGLEPTGLFKPVIWLTFLVLVVQTTVAQNSNNGTSSNKELLLTQKEKVAFDKFKNAVTPNIKEDDLDVMKNDLYLLRFIRAYNLDVDRATHEFHEFQAFAHKQKLKTILRETWDDIIFDFPIKYDAHDKQGRPVVFITTKDGWNIRNAALVGKSQRLKRYLYKMSIEMQEKVLGAGRVQPNVTQIFVFFDLEGFQYANQGCVQCVLQYIQFFQLYERWIPGYMNEWVIINAPLAVQIIINAVRPFLTKETQKIMKIFGQNKKQWQSYIGQRISKDQLALLYKD